MWWQGEEPLAIVAARYGPEFIEELQDYLIRSHNARVRRARHSHLCISCLRPRREKSYGDVARCGSCAARLREDLRKRADA